MKFHSRGMTDTKESQAALPMLMLKAALFTFMKEENLRPNREPTSLDSSPRRPMAAILAGGKGTRLRTFVSDRPKVLANVRKRCFLTYILDQLVEEGFRSVILLTGYMSEQVQASLGESYKGIKLGYSPEDEPLDTAGAVRGALKMLDSDPVLVMNGDSFCQVDFSAFIEWHEKIGAEVSMVITRIDDAARFGNVLVNEDGRIFGFKEKSNGGDQGWINAGIYLIGRPLIETIPLGLPVSLEREIFPQWINRRFYGYRTVGRFIDIGTPESYLAAQDFFE